MEDSSFASINVIPFIDIMLVLLTIVLTTSTFIATGSIAVRLPEASPEQTSLEPSILLEIDQAGQLFLDNRPVPFNTLGEHLAEREKQTPVLIRADRTISLQAFVEVMDCVKGLGFAKISLQTEVSR